MSNPAGAERNSYDKNHFSQPSEVLNIVLDHISQGMLVVGPDYRVLAFNRHFEELFQLPSGTVEIGADFREMLKIWAGVTGQDQQMLDYAILQLDEPEHFEFEFPQLIMGEPRWCLLTHNPLPGKGFVRTFTDITKRKALEATLLKLSREDPLTGLNNRRTLLELMEDELQRCQRYGHNLAFLLMDIDFFKKVNDRWGHPTGDEVLKSFARQCQAVMRDNDRMGRFGGEEFVMLLPETDVQEGVQVAERIRKTIAEMDVRALGSREKINVTVSIGVSAGNADSSGVDEIIAHADDALYQAKHQGRNRVVCKM